MGTGFRAVPRHDHLASSGGEHLAQHASDGRIVLDHEDVVPMLRLRHGNQASKCYTPPDTSQGPRMLGAGPVHRVLRFSRYERDAPRFTVVGVASAPASLARA